MASSNQIVTLNVGTQRVSAAVFSKTKKGGLILNQYDTRSIIVDPSMENVRASQIAGSIAEIVSSLKLSGSRVYYALPGHSVFVRFIKLPPIDDGDISQLVKFEAQQHIPFPLDEVVWSYHMLPDSGFEKEAVLIAIKNDLLNEIDASVVGAGLKTAGVDSAPSALYNAFRSSYPDLMEASLLIDIGSKTSNLVYIENGKFFTRSIAMGGASITSAIAREYGISFAEAENLKISKGLVALTGGHTSSMDEETSRLASTIRNAITRLVSEIPRTTNHYRSQFGGSAPQHIFLCGGGATLAYTKEFIQERLQVPVQFFNPLHAVGVGKKIDSETLSRQAYLLGELVGLGLKGAGTEEIKIDLVPLTVAKAREARKKLPVVIAGMAILVAAAGIFAWSSKDTNEKAQVLLAKEKAIQNTIDGYQSQLDKIAKEEQTINKSIEALQKLTFKRFAYQDILKEFYVKAKSDAFWVVEFEPVMKFDSGSATAYSTGTPFIIKTFKTDKSLSIAKPTEEPTTSRRSAVKKPEPATINAIRIKGLVRMDKDGFKNADLIRTQLEQSNDSSLFQFVFNGKALESQQIIHYDEKPADKDAFIKPFTIIFPLKNPIPVE